MRERLEGGFVVLCARENKRGEWVSMCVVSFGKWFKKKNFVNRFPFFSEGFSGQLQTIYVDFYFTSKQNP